MIHIIDERYTGNTYEVDAIFNEDLAVQHLLKGRHSNPGFSKALRHGESVAKRLGGGVEFHIKLKAKGEQG